MIFFSSFLFRKLLTTKNITVINKNRSIVRESYLLISIYLSFIINFLSEKSIRWTLLLDKKCWILIFLHTRFTERFFVVKWRTKSVSINLMMDNLLKKKVNYYPFFYANFNTYKDNVNFYRLFFLVKCRILFPIFFPRVVPCKYL